MQPSQPPSSPHTTYIQSQSQTEPYLLQPQPIQFSHQIPQQPQNQGQTQQQTGGGQQQQPLPVYMTVIPVGGNLSTINNFEKSDWNRDYNSSIIITNEQDFFTITCTIVDKLLSIVSLCYYYWFYNNNKKETIASINSCNTSNEIIRISNNIVNNSNNNAKEDVCLLNLLSHTAAVAATSTVVPVPIKKLFYPRIIKLFVQISSASASSSSS